MNASLADAERDCMDAISYALHGVRTTKRGGAEDDQRGSVAVIREDRELLAELARLNSDVAPLALRIMEGSAAARNSATTRSA